MKSHSAPQKSPFTLKVNCKAKMKIQFCPISVLNALHNQAVGEVPTMEIIFNYFSRKKKDPSSSHRPLKPTRQQAVNVCCSITGSLWHVATLN